MLTPEQIQEARKKLGSPDTPSQIQPTQNKQTWDDIKFPDTQIKTPITNQNNFITNKVEPLKGALKGVGSTLIGIGQLADKVITPFSNHAVMDKTAEDLKKQYLIPTNKQQEAGFKGEQIAEYLIPAGETKALTLLDDVIKNLPKLAKVGTKILSKGVFGAGEFGAKTAIQSGGNLEETKRAATVGGLFNSAFGAGGMALNKAKPIIGDIVSGTLGIMIGKPADVIKQAFKNPEKVAENMAKKTIPLEVREQAVNALKLYETQVKNNFEKGLDNLKKLSPSRSPARTEGGLNFPGVFSPVKGQFKQIVQNAQKGIPKIFNQFAVSVEKGKLNFNKLNSAIVSPAEQKQLQNVWDTIRNQNDFSAQGVERVAARLNALSKFSDGVKTQKSAIIAKIHNLYSEAINKVYPRLGEIRQQYTVDKQIIKGLDDVLKSVKNNIANPTAVTGAVKKLSNLFNEDNEAYILALKRLEQATGKDLLNELAASEFKNVFPATLGSRLGQIGFAAGAFLNPLSLLALPLFSPRAVGKLTTQAGKAVKGFGKMSPLAPLIKKLPPAILIENK